MLTSFFFLKEKNCLRRELCFGCNVIQKSSSHIPDLSSLRMENHLPQSLNNTDSFAIQSLIRGPNPFHALIKGSLYYYGPLKA